MSLPFGRCPACGTETVVYPSARGPLVCGQCGGEIGPAPLPELAEYERIAALDALTEVRAELARVRRERDALERSAAMLWLAAMSDRWTPEGLARKLLAGQVEVPPSEIVAAIRLASGLSQAGQGPGVSDG